MNTPAGGGERNPHAPSESSAAASKTVTLPFRPTIPVLFPPGAFTLQQDRGRVRSKEALRQSWIRSGVAHCGTGTARCISTSANP